jgi:hypothetical protein
VIILLLKLLFFLHFFYILFSEIAYFLRPNVGPPKITLEKFRRPAHKPLKISVYFQLIFLAELCFCSDTQILRFEVGF